VVKLDYELEEAEAARVQQQQQLEASQAQVAELQRQLAEAREAAARAQAEAGAARRGLAAGAEAGPGGAAGHCREMRASDGNISVAGSESSWGGATVEELLPKVVELWDALFVPLAYRWGGWKGGRGGGPRSRPPPLLAGCRAS
jgi:hypothetical protein